MSGLDLAKQTELKICPCKIISENLSCEISQIEIEKLISQKFKNNRAIFVAWQIQNIIWGKYDGEKLFSSSEITAQYWQECRIFNETEELHLKRIENEMRGRYITEIDGTENFYADSFARFWGENSGNENGFIKLLDKQRKLFMAVPCENKNAKWYGLKTRNYISSDEETGLSGYSDYRFVAIESVEEGADIG